MGSAEEPLMRTMPIPLSPNGVEMAAIVSSGLGGVLFEELNEEPLFTFTPLESHAARPIRSRLPKGTPG